MIINFEGNYPKIHPSCFIAPNATVIGNVEIGEGASIWFNTVIRGDVNTIRIGKKTNIQDLCMIHVNSEGSPNPTKTIIGNEVTVGHRVIIHGSTIGDRALIGMGSVLLDDVVIEEDCVIGAGSLVTEGTRIPAGHLAFGSPCKVIRPLKEEEKFFLPLSANHYYELAKKYGTLSN